MAFAVRGMTDKGRGGDHPGSFSRVGKLIRMMLAIVICMIFAGAPLAQAAIAAPCSPAPMDMLDQPSVDHSQVPMPCREKMPGCGQMPGCGISASLEARAIVTTGEHAWTRAVYWPVAGLLEGLRLAPDVGPPITI